MKLRNPVAMGLCLLFSLPYSLPARAQVPALDAAGIAAMRERGIFGPETKVCQGVGDLRILPVGFSKKGAFAYIVRTDEDAIMLWSFVVVDLVTDKRLQRITMEDPDGTFPLEEFLSRKGKEIKKALSKHRIRKGDFEKPGKWPLKYKDRKYKILWLSQELDQGSRHYVKLKAKGLGSKDIATIEAPGVDHCCKSLGYYKSPFENRIAIMLLKGSRGFEGAMVCDVVVIGSHLDVRFTPSKKKKK